MGEGRVVRISGPDVARGLKTCNWRANKKAFCCRYPTNNAPLVKTSD